SYRLSGNLTVPANTDGIVIAADLVTIDLNGFSIIGGGSGFGISDANVGRTGIAIRNGTVASFNTGIALSFAPVAVRDAESTEIQQIRAVRNVIDGINVAGHAIISGSTALLNGGTGISTSQGATIIGNVSSENDFGIFADRNSTVSGNTTTGNTLGIV